MKITISIEIEEKQNGSRKLISEQYVIEDVLKEKVKRELEDDNWKVVDVYLENIDIDL